MAAFISATLFFVVAAVLIYLRFGHYGQWHRSSKPKHAHHIKLNSKQALRASLPPYQLPPLRPRSSSRMAMGLKCLDQSNWLTIDTAYQSEHQIRARMLEVARPNVLQCLSGSEAACHEVLEAVTSFLSQRFPQHFTIDHSKCIIHNHLTQESYLIGAQCPNPMEIAARLAMEDFNILVKDPDTGEYLIKASATLFPAGWQLQEKIGTSMANLHSPVPGWYDKLGTAVNRYFDHLSARTCMERYNLFIQTTNELFQDGPEAPPPSLMILRPEVISVRRERQTFTRLEKSGAVLFTVRTYMQPLTELFEEEIEALLSHIHGWETPMKTYKGWDRWGKVVDSWCQARLTQLRGEETVLEESLLRERRFSV